MMDQILRRLQGHVEARFVFQKKESNYESIVWKLVVLNLRYDLALE